MTRQAVQTKKLDQGFAELTHIFSMHVCLLRYLVMVITVLSLMITAVDAQELETPLITNVQIAPDQKQIVIKADKALGVHSAFAFEKPYRLVIDFETTGLGKVPTRIKVDKPPISEIRLGKNGHRARMVIDFGEYPVPPFMVERKGNLAVVALGNVPTDPRIIQRGPSRETNPKPHATLPPQPTRQTLSKKDQTHVPAPTPMEPPVATPPTSANKIEQSSFVVKQSLITNNLLLVELQNRKQPSETYRIVVDLNLNELTVRNASISNSSGIVKRFDLSESGPKISRDGAGLEETSAGTITAGPRKNPNLTENKTNSENKHSLGSGKSSVKETKNPTNEPATSNPFKLEGFELKSKQSDSDKLENE